jgi:uncharacterized protein YjbJ (UPF0337 family)
MNRNTVEGKWKVFKGTIREKWGKWADDDLEKIAGKRDRLLGNIQQVYGYGRHNADEEAYQWIGKINKAVSSEKASTL